MVARRVAGNEDGVATPHEAFHMPDEHLRGQATLVHGEPVALIGDGLVRRIAHHHGAPDGFEERGPQHAEAIEQKRAGNAHYLHISQSVVWGTGNLLRCRGADSGLARISSTGINNTAPLNLRPRALSAHFEMPSVTPGPSVGATATPREFRGPSRRRGTRTWRTTPPEDPSHRPCGQ